MATPDVQRAAHGVKVGCDCPLLWVVFPSTVAYFTADEARALAKMLEIAADKIDGEK